MIESHSQKRNTTQRWKWRVLSWHVGQAASDTFKRLAGGRELCVSASPAATRFRRVGVLGTLGSGAVISVVVKVPVTDDVVEVGVELITLLVVVMVDSPVSPAKIPVPPVNTTTVVLSATPPPISVPLPVNVPKSVPSEKTSTKVPLVTNVVRLVNVSVPLFVVVKPIPEPVTIESKTLDVIVAVTVVVPVIVPVVVVESA
jgi:hypothetical protein